MLSSPRHLPAEHEAVDNVSNWLWLPVQWHSTLRVPHNIKKQKTIGPKNSFLFTFSRLCRLSFNAKRIIRYIPCMQKSSIIVASRKINSVKDAVNEAEEQTLLTLTKVNDSICVKLGGCPWRGVVFSADIWHLNCYQNNERHPTGCSHLPNGRSSWSRLNLPRLERCGSKSQITKIMWFLYAIEA